MEVRNILLGCPNLTVFWLYIDGSNVQSWNMACSLLWIIILWAVICTEILGTEFLYQLTSPLFKNRDKYVPPNCHCLATPSVKRCHTSPSRICSNNFPLKLCRLEVHACFANDVFLLKQLPFLKGSFSSSRKHTRSSLFVSFGAGLGLRVCMAAGLWLLQLSFDKHSFWLSGTINVHIKLNSQIQW